MLARYLACRANSTLPEFFPWLETQAKRPEVRQLTALHSEVLTPLQNPFANAIQTSDSTTTNPASDLEHLNDSESVPREEPAWAGGFPTRYDPGDFYAPALDQVCDSCRRLKVVQRCLYPSITGRTCVVCRRRKTKCCVRGAKRSVDTSAPATRDLQQEEVSAVGPSWAAFGPSDQQALVPTPTYQPASRGHLVVPTDEDLTRTLCHALTLLKRLDDMLERTVNSSNVAPDLGPAAGLYKEVSDEFDAIEKELAQLPLDQVRMVSYLPLLESFRTIATRLFASMAGCLFSLDPLLDQLTTKSEQLVAIANMLSTAQS